jgi:hypothetical protein
MTTVAYPGFRFGHCLKNNFNVFFTYVDLQIFYDIVIGQFPKVAAARPQGVIYRVLGGG